MAGSAVAELVEDAVAVGLLHLGVDVEARVAQLRDLLRQKLHPCCTTKVTSTWHVLSRHVVCEPNIEFQEHGCARSSRIAFRTKTRLPSLTKRCN